MPKTRWTQEEDAIITRHYDTDGGTYCVDLLPGRTIHSVHGRVQLFREIAEVEADSAKVRLIAELLPIKGSLRQIAEATGLLTQTVKAILDKQGLKSVRPAQFSALNAHRDAITKDYLSGAFTIDELCSKYTMVSRGLYLALKRWGVRSKGHKRRKLAPGAGHYSSHRVYDLWVERHGREEADRRQAAMNEKASIRFRGAGNPMFGRPCPKGAGNGWKGWYREHFFRSLRELTYMIQLDAAGTQWEGAESIRIPYWFFDRARTYSPDYLLEGNRLIEIKPTKLHNSPNVNAKRLAAEAYCVDKGWTYTLIDVSIDGEAAHAAWLHGDVRWQGDYEARFLAWLGKPAPELALSDCWNLLDAIPA